jgi:hypothetical protein
MRILTGKFLHLAVIFPLLAGGLCSVNSATAATISDVTGPTSGFDDGADSLPPADLSGWFGSFDPSNEWTNDSNIATLEAWLDAAKGLSSQSEASLSSTNSVQAFTPEPATLGLLGIALSILPFYVPLRKSDRSLRN